MSDQPLESILHQLRDLSPMESPPYGWIRSIRLALGMAGVDLARRMGIAPSSLSALEDSETADTISLNSLRRAANAMDCDLVYAIVPRAELGEVLKNRARTLAEEELGDSPLLSPAERERRDRKRDSLITELLRKPSRLWKTRPLPAPMPKSTTLPQEEDPSSNNWSFPL